MAQDWLEQPLSLQDKRIFIAGHNGMVGKALVRKLMHEGCEILTAPKMMLDLRNQAAVNEWMAKNKPDMVVICAAKVGGILANDTQPAEFLYDNLMIEANVIHAAHEAGVERLLFLGSSCIYPKEAENPICEDALLSGPLEPTNEAYAIAKIAGLKLCEAYRKQYGADFISAMPCNLYGPGDNFDVQNSHVIPALMMKAHEAMQAGTPSMEVWGSGQPRREFLYVDDLAEALIYVLKNYSGAGPINIGAGEDMSIAELAEIICEVVGYKGELVFNTERPDGTMQKLMDSSRIFDAGWKPKTQLQHGLNWTYEWYKEHISADSFAA
jgi:GDP-L-fucose synthase